MWIKYENTKIHRSGLRPTVKKNRKTLYGGNYISLCFAGSVEVSRRSPVASWLCAMLYCFGSYILADIMLGHSPIDYFHNNSHIILASAVW